MLSATVVPAACVGGGSEQCEVWKRIPDFMCQCSQTENELLASSAYREMAVKTKLAAHQTGVCWSLPVQTRQERGKEELFGK